MGNQRRSDNSHEIKTQKQKDLDHDEQHGDEHFDSEHAQVQMKVWDSMRMGKPESQIAGVGDQDQLLDKFRDAIDAKNGADLLTMVSNMSRASRNDAAVYLTDAAPLLSGSDVLRLADMVQASTATTIDAALKAKTLPSLAQMRAYLATTDPNDIAMGLNDESLLKRLRAQYPGPATDLVPQFVDSLPMVHIARWVIESTPQEMAARLMMSATADDARWRGYILKQLGRAGWLWTFHVDEAMAAIAAPGVLATYSLYVPEGNNDVKSFLQAKAAAALKHDKKQDAKDLRAHKSETIRDSDVENIERETKAAGFTINEQLEWMLDKPGLKLEDLHAALSAWSTDEAGKLTSSTIQRLRAKFSGAKPRDVFGSIPDALQRLAIRDATVRAWLVDGAEPLDILRLVTFEPDQIATMWNWLGKHGTGYAWVDQLGGGTDDHLLRRLVLKCPNPDVVKRIRERVLGDTINDKGTETTVEAIPDSAYQNADMSFEAGFKSGAKGQAQTDLVDAMSDDEVIAVRHDTVKLKTMLQRTDDASLVRLLDRVQPLLRDVFMFAPAEKPLVGLADWVSGRPNDQVIEALAHHVAAARGRKMLPQLGALELFPSLEAPSALTAVLHRNPEMIMWILESERTTALALLGSPGVTLAAVKALEGHTDLVEWLPPGQMLPKDAHDGLAALARFAKGALHDALSEKLKQKAGKDEDFAEAEHNVTAMKDVTKSGLVATLQAAFDAEESTSDEVLVRICRQNATHVGELAGKGKLIEKLAQTGLSPHTFFPNAELKNFVGTTQGMTWVLATMPAFEILRHAGNEATVRKTVLHLLDEENAKISDWVDALPRGSALSAADKNTLHTLAAATKSDASTRGLFTARFATTMHDSHYTHDEILRMWKILERIPPAHIEQGSVSRFKQFEGGKGGTVGGWYEPDTLAVSIEDNLYKRVDDHASGSEYDRFGDSTLMSKEEAKATFHVDDAGLAQLVQDDKLRLDPKTQQYSMSPIGETDMLETTLLHEVGHSVDAMLGGHTELVYGLAGWHAYAESDFDQWAADLGGWSSVSAPDQKQIREVWQMWLSGTVGNRAPESVGEMVASDHPAVAEKYSNVGVVKLARDKKIVSNEDPAVVNSRAAFVSHSQQRFHTMKPEAMHVAPSVYSLTAPGEFFAECYAFYYKGYDGTPATADQKGARVAPFIKTWLDKNVDTVGHNPKKK